MDEKNFEYSKVVIKEEPTLESELLPGHHEEIDDNQYGVPHNVKLEIVESTHQPGQLLQEDDNNSFENNYHVHEDVKNVPHGEKSQPILHHLSKSNETVTESKSSEVSGCETKDFQTCWIKEEIYEGFADEEIGSSSGSSGNKHPCENCSCDICFKTFDTFMELKDHEISHKQLSCKECDKVFSGAVEHWNHMMYVHSIKLPFECNFCGKTFNDYKYFKIHGRSNCNHLICTMCRKSFPNNTYLAAHINSFHRNEKPHKCEECGKVFPSYNGLLIHEKTHLLLFNCDICKKSFRSSQLLEVHLKAHNTRPFKCDTCEMSFNFRNSLARHKRLHRENMQFLCEICDKKFITKKSLRSHSLIHSGKQFLCSICDKTFTTAKFLKQHTLVHTDERPHPCSVCHKSFKSSVRLKKHAAVHTNERPYQCDDCKSTFKFYTSLRTHERYHCHGPVISAKKRNSETNV